VEILLWSTRTRTCAPEFARFLAPEFSGSSIMLRSWGSRLMGFAKRTSMRSGLIRRPTRQLVDAVDTLARQMNVSIYNHQLCVLDRGCTRCEEEHFRLEKRISRRVRQMWEAVRMRAAFRVFQPSKSRGIRVQVGLTS